jgi:hypothetical protein
MQQTWPLSQVHKNQCIGLIREYYKTIISTSSAIFGVKTEYPTMEKVQKPSNFH